MKKLVFILSMIALIGIFGCNEETIDPMPEIEEIEYDFYYTDDDEDIEEDGQVN